MTILGPNDPRAIRGFRKLADCRDEEKAVIGMLARYDEDAEEVRKLNEENGYGSGYPQLREDDTDAR